MGSSISVVGTCFECDYFAISLILTSHHGKQCSEVGRLAHSRPTRNCGLLQAGKMYRNWTASEEDNLRAHDAGATRKESVANRMAAGAHPPVAYFNAKYLEKQLKTNSALRDHKDEIRKAHANAQSH